MMLFAYVLLDEAGAILAINRSLDGEWLAVVRAGPAQMYLDDGRPLEMATLAAAFEHQAEVLLIGDEGDASARFRIQCHGIGI